MNVRSETAPVANATAEELAAVDDDDSLILWMLGLTPTKRLEALQNFVDGVVAIQHARRVAQ